MKERKLEHKAIQRVGKWFKGIDNHKPLTKEEIKSQLKAETEHGKMWADWRHKEYG